MLFCGAGLTLGSSPAGSGDAATRLLFSGLDLWRDGGFAHGGVVWSPGGLHDEGLALKVLLGTGVYRYSSGVTRVTGTPFLASFMPGWRFKSRRFQATVYAGLDIQHHSLLPDDPGNRLRGAHVGLRTGADLWWEPTARMMVSAAVSVSTLGTSYWARSAMGWRFHDIVYVGPEGLVSGDLACRQLRVGLHATAFRTGRLEWSAGLGWARDSDARTSLYARIELLTRH